MGETGAPGNDGTPGEAQMGPPGPQGKKIQNRLVYFSA